ncbi:TPA: hypothetical protein DIC39_03045 [Patescibacteria group bacterium]|nr:hypothetical protein [Patescibacteria group bacterium]
MSQEESQSKHKCQHHGHQASSGLYGLGFLGALVYYIQHADLFVSGLVGFIQALVWPAILMYKTLTALAS